MAKFAWECFGGPGAIVCVIAPYTCVHCAAKATAAYNLCLEGCSEKGGPSAPYQVVQNENVTQYRLGVNAELGYLNDTWVWDGITWTFVSNSGPTCGYAGMAYAGDRGVTVLYGGATATGRPRDTCEFDVIASWTLVTSNSAPGFRSFHRMVYDEVAERIHMFGGQLPGGVETSDNWVYEDGAWSSLGPSGPSPRISCQMDVRSRCGTILLYGRSTACCTTISGNTSASGGG
jgi:hypothetical protein